MAFFARAQNCSAQFVQIVFKYEKNTTTAREKKWQALFDLVQVSRPKGEHTQSIKLTFVFIWWDVEVY